MELLPETVWQMWAVFALIFFAVIAYMRPQAPIELTSLLVLLALLLLFYFFPLAAGSPSTVSLVAGFANPALLTVMALLVVGQAMFQSEALEGLTRRLAQVKENWLGAMTSAVLIVVFIITAWLNNTPVAVMFIPVLAGLAARTNITLSGVMMPLSFISILGGMTTLIGASTNILAVDIATRLGAPHFGFFDITKAALILAIPGLLYILFVMPAFLPKRSEPVVEDDTDIDGRHYIAQITINTDSPLLGMVVGKNTAVVEDNKSIINNMRILRTQRGERSFYPKQEEVILQEGDFIIVSATRDILTQAIKSRRDLFGLNQIEDRILADAVIAPASRIIGRSLSQLTLQYETGCHVLGILRRRRMLRALIQDIRLEAGDVLLVVGSKDDLQSLTNTHDVFLLNWLSTALPHYTEAIKAGGIFAAMILISAWELMPLTLAALSAAVAMILANVLNLRQAVRALDSRIFFLVATAIALATALEATNAPTYLASIILDIFTEQSPIIILTAMFLLITFVTNLLSNNAAAIIFMPIMLKVTTLLHLPPELAIITVILAANCSFATPMSHQINLLVMGPGRYQFSDFVKAGTPLILLLSLCYVVMLKVLYSL